MSGSKKSTHSARSRKRDAKHLLRFQSQLLRELTTTSESIKEWRTNIRNIVAMAGKLIDFSFIYLAFATEDEACSLEFFWQHAPAPAIKDDIERMVRDKLSADPNFSDIQRNCVVTHTLASLAAPPTGHVDSDIELQSRSFVLSPPKAIGGIGMGHSGSMTWDDTDFLIADNIFTALESIVSSVHAMTVYAKEVERFATRDALTSLYNQISFWDLLEYETRRSKRQEYKFTLLAIDIDNFKTMNDRYGHEVGDDFLKAFSTILKKALRSGDIAARYGGDQFTAILPICDEVQAFSVANRIIESLREYAFTLPNDEQARGTVSIGIAVYPDHAQDAKDLYLLADTMLTRAKSYGKDRMSIASGQDDVEVIKSMGEKSILIFNAIRLRQIVPYFQPIMNIRDSKIEAYEVLTRIVLHDKVITAADFIETAESMGAIGKIDYQLIDLALAKVRDSGYTGNLFLNLSPKALVLNEFMPTVKRLLKDYNLDPAKMVFEITERDTVKNMTLVEDFITELKRDGFRFAIDDFGAGYSSFHYLKAFSIDYLKIDGEFVRSMSGDSTIERAIVKSIASLADNLGIKTIAEYVETEDILGEVASAGIDYAQGYYVQKPSPDLF